jgi:hypothetical protein
LVDLSQDEALEKAINFSLLPHSYTLQSEISQKILAVALPYSNQVIHFEYLPKQYLSSIQIHEKTHIEDVQNCDSLLVELFFADFIKLIKRGEFDDDLFDTTSFSIKPRELRIKQFESLFEASALYLQILATENMPQLNEFGKKVIEEYRDKKRDVYQYYSFLKNLISRLIGERVISDSEKYRSTSDLVYLKNRIRKGIVFALSLVESWKIKPNPSEALRKLEKLLDPKEPLRSALGLKSRSYSALEIGLALASATFEVQSLSSIQKLGSKIGVFDPSRRVFNGYTFEEETSTYFLFVFKCLKDGDYDSILKEQIFGIADMIIKTNEFRVLSDCKNRFWKVSLPLVFYYQNENKREIIDCVGSKISSKPVPSRRQFFRLQNFKTTIDKEKALLSLDNHCPTFISKKIAPTLITGACKIVDLCNHDCIGKHDCPWKEIYYSEIKNKLSDVNLQKQIKKIGRAHV